MLTKASAALSKYFSCCAQPNNARQQLTCTTTPEAVNGPNTHPSRNVSRHKEPVHIFFYFKSYSLSFEQLLQQESLFQQTEALSVCEVCLHMQSVSLSILTSLFSRKAISERRIFCCCFICVQCLLLYVFCSAVIIFHCDTR